MAVDSTENWEALYRAAVGKKKADFYAPKFMRFDQVGDSKRSWNWPAFWVPFFWFLYRRMYGSWAIYCLLIPFALAIIGAIAIGLLGVGVGNTLYVVAILVYSFGVIPTYANALYHRAIRKRIQTVREQVPDPATQVTVLDNTPHTSAIIWVLVPFFMIAIIGILAAIAIPAYQTYTIRAQISEGLRLSGPLKTAVANQYAATKSWPATLADLGISQAYSGHYVTAIAVDHGTISIQYGNQANLNIAGHVLSLRPSLTSADQVVWACGYSAEVGENSPAGPAGENVTDIAQKYLPVACRNDRR
jgi:Tfp pilus assembly major pilin PilA